MEASVSKLGSSACGGGAAAAAAAAAAGAVPADQVKVTIIGPKEVESTIRVLRASTIRDLKDAIADANTVELQAIAMSVHKLTDSIFNHPLLCKIEAVHEPLTEMQTMSSESCGLKDIAIREIILKTCQYLGPEYHALKDTNTLQECGIIEGSMLIINKKLITQKDVLLDLYKRCGGETWTNSTNWGSDRPLKEWYGVTCNLESGAIIELSLSVNKLTGKIPASLGNLQQLKELYLSGNQLRGPIPVSLDNLQQLKELYLSGNQLTGAIPDSLGNLQRLEKLYLPHNQLTGPIPDSLGNLLQLVHLCLYENQLSGPIPATLSNLRNLIGLGLDNNQLSGEIPEELGELHQLKELHLENNPWLQVKGSQVIAALRARGGVEIIV